VVAPRGTKVPIWGQANWDGILRFREGRRSAEGSPIEGFVRRCLHGGSAQSPGAVLGLWELLVHRVCPFQATAHVPTLLAILPGHIIRV